MSRLNRFPSANDNSEDAGLYTWDLETNTLYADSAVADVFGLDWTKTEHGLPVQAYLDRVFPDDKPSLAQAISEAITSGQPFQASYRVFRADGAIALVTAFGKCFSSAEGDPKFYSGIVFPMPEETPTNSDLRWLCLAALNMAKNKGRTDVASIISEALVKLGCRPQSACPA